MRALEPEATRAAELNGWVRRAVEIDPLRLEDEYINLPGAMARAGQLYADAMECFMEAERAEELIGAQLAIEFRETLRDDKGRGPTVDEVRARVIEAPNYQTATRVKIAAECERERFRRMLDALAAKRDMLISLGAHIRREMDGSPTIRATQRAQHEVAQNKP